MKRLHGEEGQALVLVITIVSLMIVLSMTLVDGVQFEGLRSRHAVKRGAAFQAAEAGIDDYVAKLLSDNSYYAHMVHPAEATRRASDGTIRAAGSPWTSGMSWTYPNGKNAWRPLGNGYEYDLQTAAPTMSTGAVVITATGRPVGSTDKSEWRVIQGSVRPASVSDFQMLADEDISYGSTATTYGKIYALQDSGGVKHNVTHSGTAYGNIYAEGRVLGSPTMMSPAKKYDSASSPGIRTVIKSPPNFSSFLSSVVDVQHASQSGGVYLNNSAKDAWRIVFQTDGTFTAAPCTKAVVSGNAKPVAEVAPTCTAATTYAVPANGAIYVGQSAIVSGTVNGRVTIAANADIVVADNLYYADKHSGCTASGTSSVVDDILGLDAVNDVVVAQYAPNTLSWCAGTISQNGAWHSYSSDSSHGTMTFIGSTATEQGGQMSMFTTRVYKYDDALFFLQPPWFPLIAGAYTTFFERELSSLS